MNEERTYTICNIVDQLIGSTSAWGETNHDEQSLKNLEQSELLINSLLKPIIDNTRFKNDGRYSMGAIGKASQEIVNDFYLLLKDYQDYEKEQDNERD